MLCKMNHSNSNVHFASSTQRVTARGKTISLLVDFDGVSAADASLSVDQVNVDDCVVDFHVDGCK